MSGIVIVDYGMGNIGSVDHAFNRLGVQCTVSDQPDVVREARAIVLPGVGAFHAAMSNLRARGLDDVLNEQVLHRNKPFLGICLGMQLIAKDSVEIEYSTGLGWIEGHVVKLDPGPSYRVPHVGWNEVVYTQEFPLFKDLPGGAHFFFDHSYHLLCDQDLIMATSDYGGTWVAGVQRGNILAVQFHPEKSQRNGLRLLRNFVNFVAAS
jgi:glutamine amidotransferase